MFNVITGVMLYVVVTAPVAAQGVKVVFDDVKVSDAAGQARVDVCRRDVHRVRHTTDGGCTADTAFSGSRISMPSLVTTLSFMAGGSRDDAA